METANGTKRIVIVEDNADLAGMYKTKLEMSGYSCGVAYDGIAALYIIQQELPDLVLLDLMVPNIAGDQILQRMRNSNWGKSIPVVIISNLNEVDAPAGIRDYGISGYYVKANLSLEQISSMVDAVFSPKAPAAQPPPQ